VGEGGESVRHNPILFFFDWPDAGSAQCRTTPVLLTALCSVYVERVVAAVVRAARAATAAAAEETVLAEEAMVVEAPAAQTTCGS
jgi:hypothetical protein